MLELDAVTRIRLFVYGSLRAGREHHAELRGASCLGLAVTAALYRLVERHAYPALLCGSSAIHGELYAVDAETVALLDAFEGPEYRRAPVRLADGSEAEAYFSVELEQP